MINIINRFMWRKLFKLYQNDFKNTPCIASLAVLPSRKA